MFNLVEISENRCILFFSDYTVTVNFSEGSQSAEITEHSKLTVFEGCCGNGEMVKFINNSDLKRTYLSEGYLIHSYHLSSSRINEGPFLKIDTPAWRCYLLSDEDYNLITVLVTNPSGNIINEWKRN